MQKQHFESKNCRFSVDTFPLSLYIVDHEAYKKKNHPKRRSPGKPRSARISTVIVAVTDAAHREWRCAWKR